MTIERNLGKSRHPAPIGSTRVYAAIAAVSGLALLFAWGMDLHQSASVGELARTRSHSASVGDSSGGAFNSSRTGFGSSFGTRSAEAISSSRSKPDVRLPSTGPDEYEAGPSRPKLGEAGGLSAATLSPPIAGGYITSSELKRPDIAVSGLGRRVVAVPFGKPQVFRQMGIAERRKHPRAIVIDALHAKLAQLSGKYGVDRAQSS